MVEHFADLAVCVIAMSLLLWFGEYMVDIRVMCSNIDIKLPVTSVRLIAFFIGNLLKSFMLS